MPFRCKQGFFPREKCLLDLLLPFGTSCSLSFSPSKSYYFNKYLKGQTDIGTRRTQTAAPSHLLDAKVTGARRQRFYLILLSL
jgi:hypothetical protein